MARPKLGARRSALFNLAWTVCERLREDQARTEMFNYQHPDRPRPQLGEPNGKAFKAIDNLQQAILTVLGFEPEE